MTEIPEHLLKRSRERRAAIGGEGADAEPAAAEGAAEPAAESPSAAPVPAAAAAAAVPEPVVEPPKPVRPEVAAALSRRKVPYWAMPVLAALPLWAYVFQATLEPPPGPTDTPIALGQAEFAGCAACHGADGQGISGPALTGVLQTWPDFRDQMAWVRLGSQNWPGTVYGAPGKPKNGGMPSHPGMTDQQLAEVVLYERATFGGLVDSPDPQDEYSKLEAIAEGQSTLKAEGLGPVATQDGVDPSAAFGA